MRGPIWFCFLMSVIACPSFASVHAPDLRQSMLTERQNQLWRAPQRAARFSDIQHASADWRCEASQPPQALTTPDPLLTPDQAGVNVEVSFIIGVDGRVYSPLILKSAGRAGDHSVLRTIRSWRYRPATCNGVPTEAESRIEFSRR